MNIAILLAAGSSSRAGQDKLWADINGRPLWTLAYETLHAHPQMDQIFLVVREGEESRFFPFLKTKTQVVLGGATRMDSFRRALTHLALQASDIILDHNAANPLLSAEEISAVIETAKKEGACAVAHPIVDTVLAVEGTQALSAIQRERLRLMQTPQAVQASFLKDLNFQDARVSEATDLTTALMTLTPVQILPSHPLNKKITFDQDIENLRAHFLANAQSYLGEDSHRFSRDGQLTLGGLTLSEYPAMEANSDGDVILHALGRAMAQAHGENFSEKADLLCAAGEKRSSTYFEGYQKELLIHSVSISLEGARPKIDPLISALKKSLSQILNLAQEAIHISAHTGEDLSPFGEGKGLACKVVLTATKKRL